MSARFVAALLVLVFSPSMAAAQTEQIEYYGLDALGSVRVIFDAQGNTVDRMDYGPFGENLRAAIKFPSQQFGGLEADSETSTRYAKARMYDPGIGRMNRPDPMWAGLFEPQLWNRYSYVLNRPQNLTDPSGLCPTDYCEEVNVVGTAPRVSTVPAGIRGTGTGADGDDLVGLGDDEIVEEGAGSSQDVPVSSAVQTAIQNALNEILTLNPTPKCEANVINKVFKQGELALFKNHLSQGVSVFDGTASATSTVSIFSNPRAGTAFVNTNPGTATIQQWFQNKQVNAVTSTAASTFTIYVRPSIVNLKNGGVNRENFGLVFHEGLHSYGKGLHAFSDQGLSPSFNVKPPSVNISRHIARNCK